jgi:ABC-type multidrug transport system fused ATPase/permease subunit
VPQQIFLSDASIAENIAFGQDFKNIDLEAMEEAAKIANLHEFVSNELPKNYKTLVGERGVRLSGGQRQRIGIARAFYNKPKILILDEATSALDTLTEKKVMDNIQNLKDKITIIIVAHRLSTVKNCEKIFILEKGEVKYQGTYQELIANNKDFLAMAST